MVGTFAEYRSARRAVEVLIARGVRPDRVYISGDDLRLLGGGRGLRTQLGALGWALAGGAALGVIIGVVFSVLDLVDPLVSGARIVGWGIAVGGAAGILGFLFSRWLDGGLGDKVGARTVEASRYDVCTIGEPPADARWIKGPVVV